MAVGKKARLEAGGLEGGREEEKGEEKEVVEVEEVVLVAVVAK